MAVFEYEVLDRDGKIRKGQREAGTENMMQASLAREGLFVINVRRAGGGIGTIALPDVVAKASGRKGLADAFARLFYHVKTAELVLFTGQLAAMIGAGVQLLRGLTALATEIRIKHFKQAIEQVAADVEGGESLADAMARHPWAFDRTYVALTRVGETSGNLSEVLSQHTTYLEKVTQLRRKVVGALAYPLVILSVAGLILFIMILYVVPIFERVYRQVQAPLPAPTQMLIGVSQGIRSNILLTVVLMGGVALGLYIWVQTDHGRRLLDRLKLHLPIFGPLIRKSSLAKVCRTLALLLHSGVLVLEALEIAAEVAGNRIIEEAVRRAINDVKEGGTIADALRPTGQFPSLVIQMVATGEETGKLPDLLEKAATYYEQQVDNTVNALSTLLEPILITLLGAIAGFVIISLYLPIFNIGRALRGGGARL